MRLCYYIVRYSTTDNETDEGADRFSAPSVSFRYFL